MFLVLLVSIAFGAGPVSLPDNVRVESSEARVKLWQKLPANEKKLAYELIQAARAGRSLMYFESHRHALTIRDVLTRSLTSKKIGGTKKLLGQNFNEYLVYTAKFLDNYGPYDMRSQIKAVLTKVTQEQMREVLKLHGRELTAANEKEILALMFDPTQELKRKPVDSSDRLEETGGNLYEKGITKEEVNTALEQKKIEIPLNCRVVRSEAGLKCEIHTVKTPGIIGEKLRLVESHLIKAKSHSKSEHQKAQIDHFIKYLHTGDEKDFRAFNIEWLKDRTDSTLDVMIGWVETYDDFLNRIGSWENYVLLVDREVTKKSAALAKNAQYFENLMPYEYMVEGEKKAYRKTFAPDYSPPAIMGYYFEEVSSIRTGGFNLPNFEDIRKTDGFKNVIRLPFPGQNADPEAKAMREQVVMAFTTRDRVKDMMDLYETGTLIQTLLHEVIGHGSGIVDPVKYADGVDPSIALGSLGASLEEERADLTGLVFGSDPKLVEAGVVKDEAERLRLKKTSWDLYLATSFSAAVSRAKSLNQTHVRGRFLLMNKLLEAKAIGWESQDGGTVTGGNQVLVVKDYGKAHEVAVALLSELQRIKALREEGALKALFAKYSPTEAINEPWAKILIDRGKDIAFFRGYIDQPWRIDKHRAQALGERTLEGAAPYWAEFYGAK